MVIEAIEKRKQDRGCPGRQWAVFTELVLERGCRQCSSSQGDTPITHWALGMDRT